MRDLCQEHNSTLEEGRQTRPYRQESLSRTYSPWEWHGKGTTGYCEGKQLLRKGTQDRQMQEDKTFCYQVAPCVQRAARPEAREAAVQVRGFLWMLHTHQDKASCIQTLPQVENLPIWEQLRSQSRKWMCFNQERELHLEQLDTNSPTNTKGFPQ